VRNSTTRSQYNITSVFKVSIPFLNGEIVDRSIPDEGSGDAYNKFRNSVITRDSQDRSKLNFDLSLSSLASNLFVAAFQTFLY